jgi:glucosamine-phosphate N-acetyltransferase
MARVRVRSAEPGDFDAVVGLLEQLGRAEVTDETRERCREIYQAQLADPTADHLVAEDEDGAVVGFCSLHFRDCLNYATPQAWIPDLIVDQRARRRGTGRALLEEAERRARARGCWVLTLESAYWREEAHRLYTTAGMADAAKVFTKSLD